MSVKQVFIYIAVSLIPAALAVLVYFLFKHLTDLQKKKNTKFLSYFEDGTTKFYWISQIITGIFFGVVGIAAYYLSVNVYDYVHNITIKVGTSSFYPVVSGLIFGAPSALISTLILFIFRIAIPSLLRWPTVISIVLGGVITAISYQFLFKGRCKKWYYALFIGALVETVNMILILLFNLRSIDKVYQTISQFDLVCILSNAGACAITVLLICIIKKEKLFSNIFKENNISTRLQLYLFVITLLSMVSSTTLTYGIVYNDAMTTYQTIISNAMFDIKEDIETLKSPTSYEKIPDRHIVSKSGFCLLINEDNIIKAAPRQYSNLINQEYYYNDGSTIFEKPKSVLAKNYNDCTFHYYKQFFAGWRCLFLYCQYNDTQSGHNWNVQVIVTYDEISKSAAVSSRTVLYVDIIVFISLFALINYFVNRKIVKNVEKLDASLEKIMDGQLDEEVHLEGTFKEFETLSNNINLTIGALKNYGAEIEKRIEDELVLARNIQSNAVPTLFPVEKNYNIYAMMKTAKDVGGDFYDYYKMNNGLVMFLIADVSGKGIPGALFMMRAKTIIKSLSATGDSLENIVTRANAELLTENEAGLFVTAWIGILNPKNGELRYVNAGHNTPLLRRANGKYELFQNNHNLVLAGYDNYQFKSDTIYLNKGDEILLYTDGVIEAINSNNEQYGLNRLIEFVNKSKYFNAKQLLDNISDDVFKFSGGMVEQFDDITMLSLRYDGDDDVKPDNVLTIKAYPKNASIAINFVESILSNNELDQKLIAKLSIVVDELFANVAYHAYPEGHIGELNIEVDIKDGNLVLIFVDSGIEFDSTKETNPDINESIETRKRGGLGLFIVRNSVDKMSYKRENGFNILKIEKKVK